MRLFLLLYIIILLPVLPVMAQEGELPENLVSRDSVRILVTDSGLGGLSVAARVEQLLSENRMFRRAEVIFVNALPGASFRFNAMKTEKEKTEAFSAILDSLSSAFRPDVILIACNTLSVLYPQTAFASSSAIPVYGIVGFGVDALLSAGTPLNKPAYLILGTETTIQSGAYRAGLAHLGISYGSIYSQACPDLETEIQNDVNSSLVAGMLDLYLDEALAAINPGCENIVVGLCCSHYGYAAAQISAALQAKTKKHFVLVNPNVGMAELFRAAAGSYRFAAATVTLAVYSQAELTEAECSQVAALLLPGSAAAADALLHYNKLLGLLPAGNGAN